MWMLSEVFLLSPFFCFDVDILPRNANIVVFLHDDTDHMGSTVRQVVFSPNLVVMDDQIVCNVQNCCFLLCFEISFVHLLEFRCKYKNPKLLRIYIPCPSLKLDDIGYPREFILVHYETPNC